MTAKGKTMRSEVIRELAIFRDVQEYQVEMWDDDLVDYFIARQEKFQQFRHSSGCAKNLVWLEGLHNCRR